MTAPFPATSRSAFPAVQAPLAASLSSPTASSRVDNTSLLMQLMPLAQLALWEAWDSPLELIALHFGQSARATLPLEPTQLEVGCAWDENVYPPDREKLHAFLGAPLVPRAGKSVDYRLIAHEGELLWVRHWLLQRAPADHGRHRLLGLIMPIPEQKHLEWECLRVSDRECNRVGQELHDDLCQVLAGLSFMLHVLGGRAARLAPTLGAEIRGLNTEVQRASDRVRAMAHGLFPAHLDIATLRDALNQLARQTRTRFAIAFTLDLPRRLPPHTAEQTMHVYRIAQEAVSNAVRHGAATAVRVVIEPVSGTLVIAIEDNGSGFPAAAVRPEGIGLHIMQYRAGVLGGTVQVANLPAGGACVRLTYPVSSCTSARSRKPQNPL